jgi:diguanylate cyclase (GGDEF)-like protein
LSGVLLGEEKLEKVGRAAHTRGRDQRQRLWWTGATAASYGVDTLFLGLFAAAGTIPGFLPLAYGAAAALICGGTFAVTVSGLNLRARDPSLTVPLMALALLLQLAIVGVAPQIAFPFLANLFTVFAFGMIWMTLRQSLVVWTLGVVALGALFNFVGDRLSLPAASAFERGLVWLYFSLILGRCLLLSVQANALRRRLAEGRAKLAESLEQMQQLASHDDLTRTLNRRSLMARLEQERSRAARGRDAFSVALLDLDHFKAVNDTYGHAVGDEVLKGFARTAHGGLRDSDAFGRYGGEEFMLILGGTPPGAALPAVDRMRLGFATTDWDAIAPGLRVTVSAGVAGYRAGETISQLLCRADEALYEAKHAGRNRVVTKD